MHNYLIIMSLELVMKDKEINEQILKFIMDNKIETMERTKAEQNITITFNEKISSDE